MLWRDRHRRREPSGLSDPPALPDSDTGCLRSRCQPPGAAATASISSDESGRHAGSSSRAGGERRDRDDACASSCTTSKGCRWPRSPTPWGSRSPSQELPRTGPASACANVSERSCRLPRPRWTYPPDAHYGDVRRPPESVPGPEPSRGRARSEREALSSFNEWRRGTLWRR